jgi:hypothetical protein
MTNDGDGFVETLEYRRFAEFCEACSRYRYIGLCHGPAGVGKTLSARHFARWDLVEDLKLPRVGDEQIKRAGKPGVAFHTVDVVNAPGGIQSAIRNLRRLLSRMAQTDFLRLMIRAFGHGMMNDVTFSPPPLPLSEASRSLPPSRNEPADDPTRLILLDEADRLSLKSLEQVRACFDEANFGLVLIGMPGLEKRIARYPQFYSRVGFVHEFRLLNAAEVTRLLQEQRWTPRGVCLPPLNPEAVAAVIRLTNGNFRLIHRLLSRIERLVEINRLDAITAKTVEEARNILVIGK